MPGVPVARKGVPNQASADRAFQLDLLAGSLNFQKHSGFFSRTRLFLFGRPQGSPRDVGDHGSATIQQTDISRLHQRVDANHFKGAFVLRRAHVIASFRNYHLGFGRHFRLQSVVVCLPQFSWPSEYPARPRFVRLAANESRRSKRCVPKIPGDIRLLFSNERK